MVPTLRARAIWTAVSGTALMAICEAQAEQPSIREAAATAARVQIAVNATPDATLPTTIKLTAGATLWPTDDRPRSDVYDRLQAWPVRTGVTFARGANLFHAGVVGQRGSALPLHVTEPLSPFARPLPSIRSFMDLSGRTTWSFNGRAERVLWKRGRKSIALVFDLTVPTGSGIHGAYNAAAVHSAAVFFGIRIRF